MAKKQTMDTTDNQSNYIVWIIVALLLVIIASFVGYKLKVFDRTQSNIFATLDDSCDLHKGPCKLISSDGSSVSLQINPNTIPLLERLQLRVEIEGISVKKVEIDLTGLEIDLGYNRPKLKAINKTTFIGEAFLPVCTLSEMDWSAKVLLYTDKGLIMAPYKFHTIKKSTIYDL